MDPTTTSLSARIAAHVDSFGSRPSAVRAAARWSTVCPALADYRSPAGVAAGARTAGPEVRDRLVAGLLGLDAGDEWAGLTVVAVVAPAIASIAGRWRRAGLPALTVRRLEADLTVETWAAVHQVMAGRQPLPRRSGQPGRVGWRLVDTAAGRVRAAERTEARRRDRSAARGADLTASVDDGGRPGRLLLAEAIVADTIAGRVTRSQAVAVWGMRVSGLTSTEVAATVGSTPAAVRMAACRAGRSLAASAGLAAR